MTEPELLLLPRPHSVRMLGGWVDVPPGTTGADSVTMRGVPGRDHGDQSYTLRVAPGRPFASVQSGGTIGIRHGEATLRQLLRQFPLRMPALEITDAPAFRTRGVMLDASRCRIPTMAEFRRLIPELAGLKINHLQLYTEHTFAYTRHQDIWRGWSPITPGEVRELDALCIAHGIELAANQNCFGHLRQWLEHPRYAHLAETHGDWMFDVWPRSGPFSLCPTDPASLAFVEELLGELLPCFSAPLVNIGCDETYDIAYGRSRAECARRGRGTVFAEFVSKVAAAADRRGKRSMFWADIALSHPECLALLPRNLIALAWGYEPDAPFARWCETLGAAGMETWVCPGTSSWRSITGRTTERRVNIAAAAEQGVAGKATGFLTCDWGDSGHWQQWPIARHGIAHGAAAAWQGDGAFDTRAASMHAHADASLRVGSWLDELGDADLALRETCLGLSRPGMSGKLRNQSAVFADLFKTGGDGVDVGTEHAWRAGVGRLAGAESSLPVADAELEHTLALARLAFARFGARRGWGAMPSADAWREIESSHRHLWMQRSREGGLEQSRAFFGRITQG